MIKTTKNNKCSDLILSESYQWIRSFLQICFLLLRISTVSITPETLSPIHSKTPFSKPQFQSTQSYLKSPSTDHPFIHPSKTTYSINTPNEQQISVSYNHMDSSKANKAKLTRHPVSMIDRRAGKSDVTFFIPMKGKGERSSVRK